MLFSWIASYGQVLIDPETQDTLVCYDTKTLRKIAHKITYADECDSLYKLQNIEIKTLDSTIILQKNIIHNKDSIILNKNIMITDRDEHINTLNTHLKKANYKLKWLKLGWSSTAIGLGAAFLFLFLR